MARIKMLKTACGPAGSFIAGTEYADVADDLALAFVEASAAILLSDPPAPPKIERAVVTAKETAEHPANRRGARTTRPATAPPRDPGRVTE